MNSSKFLVPVLLSAMAFNAWGGNCGANSTTCLPASWEVSNLGTIAGDEESHAYGINNAGTVVGYTFTQSVLRQHPFVYQGGQMYPMLTPYPDASIKPMLVNINNVIAGFTYQPQALDSGRAFIFEGGVQKTVASASIPKALNDDGKLVGNAQTWDIVGGIPRNFRNYAYLYFQNASTDLTAKLGIVSANGINRQGDIVGEAANHQAYVYRNDILTTLGVLKGTQNSSAAAINGAGVIVGTSYNVDPATSALTDIQAFIYADGKMSRLNGYCASRECIPLAINEAGLVLGKAATRAHVVTYFLYQDGRYINLSDLPELKTAGWSDVTINGMNDRGQLVGSGTVSGAKRALLLTPASGPGKK